MHLNNKKKIIIVLRKSKKIVNKKKSYLGGCQKVWEMYLVFIGSSCQLKNFGHVKN